MLFYGVDITDKIKLPGEGDNDYPSALRHMVRAAHGGAVREEQRDGWRRICAQPLPEKSPYIPALHHFDAAMRHFYSAQIENCCPWFNNLVLVLQGRDAINPLISFGEWYDGGDWIPMLLVGFWPAAFPLEIGRETLPKAFLEQAAWIEWNDED